MSRWLNKVGSGYQPPMAEMDQKFSPNNAQSNPNAGLMMCPMGPMGGQMVDPNTLTEQQIDDCFRPTPSYIPFDEPSYEGDTHMDCYDCENKSAAPQRFVIGDHINDDGTTGCPQGTIQANLNINRTNQSVNPCVSGCMEPDAENYNSDANTEDGSCEFEDVEEELEEELEELEESDILTAGASKVPDVVWYGLIAAVLIVIAKKQDII